MLSRRHFMSTAAAGTTFLAAADLLASGEGSVMPTKGKLIEGPLPTNKESGGKYRPPYRVGVGCVAIGNGFAPTTDEESQAALEAAWAVGVRYFDTSPFYGYGLSERRLGHFLHNHQPEEYVLSTKVGRIFKATSEKPKPSLWKEPSPFAFEYDYTADGVRRSIEDSLQRLGVSQIDIVFIHDLSPDNGDMGEKWTEYFEVAKKGAMPELTRMRDEGLIKAWGFGVNRPEPALRAAEVADPDLFLLATQYSLIEHDEAAKKTLPTLEKKGVSVVVGAPLMAGYLAGRERYLYGGTIPEWAPAKREKLAAAAAEHGIDLRTAALQFANAPRVVSAVIPGARTPEQAIANAKSLQVEIPAEFWESLRRDGLIAKEAAVPGEA
ncbi:aldo/keto reductase [Lacipirellula parvula]|uniref:Dehydrogenase n=1 Tax=Lacipirellula parvula TaxID=2650471 RepID=A0A5K7XHS8_9BACT|nr:aldo/keto reductase [Lacipirellula parvula]BBO35955.1 dehydrogenase [Lacipirellula parvula]